MKKLVLVLFLFTIIFTSCDEYYHKGVIRQYIESSQSTANSFNIDYVLKTVVYYDGKLILNYEDKINIDNTEDIERLKRLRYKQAITLIDKLRVINDLEVSKK